MPVASSGFLRRAASMSSYYNRRGSPRPHRGYSSRPSPPPAYAGAEFVSGDSHLSAVHAANDSLRRGGGAAGVPPPQYRHGPQFQPPPYGFGQPQQPVPSHGFVPYNYSHPQPLPPGSQYGYGTPNQYGYWHPQPYGAGPPNAGFPTPNAGYRPGAPHQPPRLAEYHRRWRFAQKQPPRQAERFKVLSYNILADYLAQEHHDLYENIPSFILDWNWRKNKIAFEIGLWHPDILCLQEVDKFTDFEQEMATRGFSGIWKMRTGNAADGCAIFWRTTRFQLRYEEDIEFNKLGLRDNVAQLCVLESVVPRNGQIESIHLSTSPSHPQQARQVVICNIHVLYNPKRGDIKLGQVRTLLDRAYTISKIWNDAPVILCGDFNSTPKSPLYNFISEQKLNLSGLARNAISGQQSSPQGLYTGPNTSRYRFRPPFHTTNGREGRTFPLDSRTPQTEARNLVRDKEGLLSCLEGPVKDVCNSDAEAQGMATEGEEGTAVDNSCEEGFAESKVESREKPNIVDFSHSPTTLYDEILQSDSSETVDSTHTLKTNESFGLKDSVEELRGVSSKDPSSQGDLSSDVTCGFEGNIVHSDMLLNVSEDDPCDKEKGHESMSGQNNCTTSESESSYVGDSLKLADALHNMSNTRLAEESNTGPTQIASPVEPVHQANCAVSDSYGNQCTPEMVNKHSDLYSYRDEFGNHVRAFEDDALVNDNLCSDVNPDPSFFKEFSGDNESLHADEDQLPTISNGLSHAQGVVTYGMYYNDPFRWTADELKAATGDEQCTYVEHNLKVRSVYTDVEDFEGTKDANKEPLVTSYHRKFMGTVDYIWASEDLQTVDVLDTFPKEILKQTTGFPTKKWGSDHIALVCELAFTK